VPPSLSHLELWAWRPQALPVARHNTLLTVREVAALAGVTERIVWTDIRTRRIHSLRIGGRRLIPRASVNNYRSTNHNRKNLLTVRQVALLLSCSERAIRNWISCGDVPTIRVSRRRLYISANAPGLIFGKSMAANFGGHRNMQKLLERLERTGRNSRSLALEELQAAVESARMERESRQRQL
jgi:excisionase family DNA binding protein